MTLALRSEGDARHIAVNASGDRVTDIRGKLGRGDGSHVFTGIYCVNPDFLEMLPSDEKVSVIPAFLESAKQGRLGAVVLDDGVWLDLGDHEAYLRAHRDLHLAPQIHLLAVIAPEAIVENSTRRPRGARIAAGAVVRNSVIWPGGQVLGDAVLDDCIVCSARAVRGVHQGADL